MNSNWITMLYMFLVNLFVCFFNVLLDMIFQKDTRSVTDIVSLLNSPETNVEAEQINSKKVQGH
jgi:hypothetical protein